MSAFDDEFGLFGDEAPREEEERRPTLGARRIASSETVIDEIEPEDEPVQRRRGARTRDQHVPHADDAERPRRRRAETQREPLAPEIAHPRAVELLEFLAKKLVSKPDAVAVALHPDARGAVLELEVDPDDLGKVIGRGGRVAQALRTLVRAGAEGRVTVDIVDVGEEEEASDGDEGAEAPPQDEPASEAAPEEG
jgi:predicted RNA-binding protein YlqC (UPF0109 family)